MVIVGNAAISGIFGHVYIIYKDYGSNEFEKVLGNLLNEGKAHLDTHTGHKSKYTCWLLDQLKELLLVIRKNIDT